MTSVPQAQWRLLLQKPQQEGLVVCLALAEWLQHCGFPPFEFLHINGPDRLHGVTAGPAFMLTASLAYFLQTPLYGSPSLSSELHKQVEMEQPLMNSALLTMLL